VSAEVAATFRDQVGLTIAWDRETQQ